MYCGAPTNGRAGVRGCLVMALPPTYTFCSLSSLDATYFKNFICYGINLNPASHDVLPVVLKIVFDQIPTVFCWKKYKNLSFLFQATFCNCHYSWLKENIATSLYFTYCRTIKQDYIKNLTVLLSYCKLKTPPTVNQLTACLHR